MLPRIKPRAAAAHQAPSRTGSKGLSHADPLPQPKLILLHPSLSWDPQARLLHLQDPPQPSSLRAELRAATLPCCRAHSDCPGVAVCKYCPACSVLSTARRQSAAQIYFLIAERWRAIAINTFPACSCRE